MRCTFAAALLCISIMAGCHRNGGPAARASEHPQLFDGLGSHTRTVTTSSREAQRYFDQGLTLAYAFNHDEAIRSFTEAARLDPHCAMAWWGIALANGPHINNPAMTPERSAAAWAALTRARAESDAGHATPTERELIRALSARYADPAPQDRSGLDAAYADAMRRVWKAHPNDADVGCLFAESLMDLHPWDMWENRWSGAPNAGAPKAGTPEVLATLEAVLTINPEHPGANHYYIHAVEASPQPARGTASADRLRTLVPAAGHLVHMPAHIDVRVGRWDQASEANRKAIVADTKYRALSPKQDFYRVYMAHNDHFLAWSCMMQGRHAEALAAARAMVAGIPDDYMRQNAALVDPYTAIVLEVHMRFGRWDDILREPEPPADLPITRALWRFSRAVAYAAKGDVSDALAEQALFREQAAAVPSAAMMAINPAHTVLEIADKMLDGEIAYRQGRTEDAVRSLRDAAAVEDGLRYMEPPEWVQPVRHPLGAILLHAGRYDEAERVYREDLARWPGNGWALFGLAECQRAKGDTAAAERTEAQFGLAWADADTPIRASCLCVQPKE